MKIMTSFFKNTFTPLPQEAPKKMHSNFEQTLSKISQLVTLQNLDASSSSTQKLSGARPLPPDTKTAFSLSNMWKGGQGSSVPIKEASLV